MDDLDRQELIITRKINAPREVVFRAWTEAKLVSQWFCPDMFTIAGCDVDARPGGRLIVEMRAPDGTIYPNKCVFREVVSPERIVFTSVAMEDEEGRALLETLNTVTFEESDGRTRMTLHVKVVTATDAAAGPLAGMKAGFTQSLDHLVVLLETAHIQN